MRKKIVAKRKRPAESKPVVQEAISDVAAAVPPYMLHTRGRQRPAPDPLRSAATRVIALMEEMINSNALRLPYPGVIEALADLKRALDTKL